MPFDRQLFYAEPSGNPEAQMERIHPAFPLALNVALQRL